MRSIAGQTRDRVFARALLVGFSPLLVLGVLATSAEAQCAGGRVVTEETAGRCCWPGQHWNDANGRCEGAPQCPAGMGGAGATCEPIAVPSAPSAPIVDAVVASAPRTFAAPSPEWARPPAPVETVPTWGLVVTGTSMFFSSWLPLVVLGTIQLTGYGFCTEWGGANYVPLLGGAISALGADLCVTYYDGGTLLYGSQYAASGVQILGFVLFIAGLVSRREPRRAYTMDWEIAPGVTLGPAPGMSGVALRF